MSQLRLCLIITFCLSLLAVMNGCCKSKTTAMEVKQIIQQEVPIGSDKSRVMLFLSSRNIEQGEYVDYEASPQYKSESAFTDHRLDSKRGSIRGFIAAIMRNTDCKLFTETNIRIRFFLDEKGNLVEYTVDEVNTTF